MDLFWLTRFLALVVTFRNICLIVSYLHNGGSCVGGGTCVFDHRFFHWPMALVLLLKLFPLIEDDWVIPSSCVCLFLSSLFHRIWSKYGGLGSREMCSLFCWVLWLERNAITFEEKCVVTFFPCSFTRWTFVPQCILCLFSF